MKFIGITEFGLTTVPEHPDGWFLDAIGTPFGCQQLELQVGTAEDRLRMFHGDLHNIEEHLFVQKLNRYVTTYGLRRLGRVLVRYGNQDSGAPEPSEIVYNYGRFLEVEPNAVHLPPGFDSKISAY